MSVVGKKRSDQWKLRYRCARGTASCAHTLLPIVFDKDKVFGKSTSLDSPYGFLASSVGDILDNPQYGDAKTSSSFAAVRSVILKPGENITVASVYGRADHIEEVPKIATCPGSVMQL